MKINKKVIAVRTKVDKSMVNNFELKHYIRLPSELFHNKDYCRDNKNKTTLYWYLCSRVIRKSMKFDQLDIFTNYYKEKYLACSVPMSSLSKLFGFKDNKQIRVWLKSLIDDGYIVIDKVPIDKYRKRNVYIVGVHDNTVDYYYIYAKYRVGVKSTPTDGVNMTPTDGVKSAPLE